MMKEKLLSVNSFSLKIDVTLEIQYIKSNRCLYIQHHLVRASKGLWIHYESIINSFNYKKDLFWSFFINKLIKHS